MYDNTTQLKIAGDNFFWGSKRLFDITMSLILLPVMIFLCVFLFFVNWIYNPGPIFFFQYRMGLNCRRFMAVKFRTMNNVRKIKRKFDDPVESHRITPLGDFLRKSRLDELPQIINVLKGEMSLIGPRPDYYKHAIIFSQNIDEYKLRHVIRPGISGLAQIRLGYVEGLDATRQKANIDIYYIQNAGFLLDTKIFLTTIYTIIKRVGV